MFLYLFTAAINSSAETRFCSPVSIFFSNNFALIHLVFTYDSDKRIFFALAYSFVFFSSWRHPGRFRFGYLLHAPLTKNTHRKPLPFHRNLMNNTSVPFTASFRIKFELVQHSKIRSAPKNTDTRYPRHTEYSGQIVIASTTCDTADLYVQRLHFKIAPV